VTAVECRRKVRTLEIHHFIHDCW